MSISSIELWQQIAAAQLATPQQCRSWAAEVARHLPAAETIDGIKVLQRLVELGKVTDYQARILAGHSTQPLREAQWTVRQIVDEGVWCGWWELVRPPEYPSPVWSRWLDGEQLAAMRTAQPSLTRAMKLASIEHPHLQQVRVPIREAGRLQVLVSPVPGQVVSQAVKGAVAWREATDWVLAVARGLAEIHRLGLTHGRVLPDRITLAMSRDAIEATAPNEHASPNRRMPILLCDPLAGATSLPDRSARGMLAEQLGSLTPEQFLAPEFLAPGQLPTAASDVYALGCTWYWLLTGKPPANGRTPQETLASQVAATVSLPPGTPCDERVARCLSHCLAKNLSARFSTADELVRALEQALLPAPVGSVRRTNVESPAVESPANKEAASQAPVIQAPVVREPLTQESIPGAEVPGAERLPHKVAAPQRVAAAELVEPTPSALARPDKGDKPAKVEAKLAFQDVAPGSLEQTAAPKQPTTPKQSVASDQKKLEEQLVEPEVPAVLAQSNAPEHSVVPTDARPSSIATDVVKRRKRRKGNPRLLILAGGICGFALLLLGLLKFSGALEPRAEEESANQRETVTYRPKPNAPTQPSADPRAQAYTLVEADNHLWAPPALPTPVPVDLLPPGGELFISCRPKQLLQDKAAQPLLSLLDGEWQAPLARLGEMAGQPLESIEQATIVGYDPASSDGQPEWAVRCTLIQPQALSELKQRWQISSTLDVDGESLLLSATGLGYYIGESSQLDVASIQAFSCGPVELMKGVAEFKGAAGPMTNAMEKLWQQSDLAAALSFQASPRFLFTGGRALLASAPVRFREELNKVLNPDSRAVLVKTYLTPQWYLEAQVIGQTDRDAPSLIQELQEQLSGAPANVESWLVDSPPHPYWGAVALRYPQMLRQFNEYARYGVEDGVAIFNAYLPSDGGVNLMAASWIAMQPAATQAVGASPATTPSNTQPFTVDALLERPIRLTFDQQPIEVALQLIGEEALADLPPGSAAPRFVLDGDAFEKGGITRNQQLRDFKIENQSVRDALTEVAKRGNPVTTVTDTRQSEQSLIWVLAPDPESAPESPGALMILLTTREAAIAAGNALPKEFAP